MSKAKAVQGACKAFIEQYPSSVYIIAYSGGIDSQVLLHALSQQLDHKQCYAVHVHHGLSVEADNWLIHCQQTCQDWGIAIRSLEVRIDTKSGKSIEAMAREKRYQALQQIVKKGEYVLTAQHRDDQAETVLLQLFRGAGLNGLAAMPYIMPFAKGHLVRPLLSVSQQEIKDYAEYFALTWVEDKSNQDTRFDRNFLRQIIIPQLQQRWPQVNTCIARSATHLGQALSLQEQQVKEHYSVCQQGAENLSISKLKTFNVAQKIQIIRYWIQLQGVSLPDSKIMQQIVQQIASVRSDNLLQITWGNHELRKYQDNLYLMQRLAVIRKQWVIDWDACQTLALPDNLGLLQVHTKTGDTLQPLTHVTVRLRRGGEKCYYRNIHKSVKKWLQEQQIPPWQRERMPFIYYQQQLLQIGAYRCDCNLPEWQDRIIEWLPHGKLNDANKQN